LQNTISGSSEACVCLLWVAGYSVVNNKEGGSTWAIVLLAAYLQRQAGLSTVGEAHLLAVDWLGWICYF